jgi:hypothetical protein
MSIEIGWRSQPYPAEGGTAAEGIRSQLGRPDLDLLTVLVREAAQNSWDARLPVGQVRFRLDLRTVGPAHAATWREQLASGVPSASRLPLREKLNANAIRLLVVSDRGTSGLGGPTRADQHAPDDRDFISFIRNVGEPRDKLHGGGTYGFGKGIFYLLARSGTVLVHTRCLVDGRPQSRLIGCALWQSYKQGQNDGSIRPYTGRHWWGELTPEIVEPLTGQLAESTAASLGLPGFEHDETGTDIVVIDPDLEDREPRDAAEYLAETIAWQLWPKMIESEEGPAPMSFSVTCDGVQIPVPDPETVRPLSMFVSAYRKMHSDFGRTLACQRPVQNLGRLGLHRGYVGQFAVTPASTMVGIEDGVHHVCLMRSAELVVRYYPGPRLATQIMGYAGVFKADRELDDTFAKAEPPTHDNWIANQLVDREKTYVRTTFRRIDEQLEKFAEPGNTEHSSSTSTPLGAVSSFFSPLVGGAWGDGGATDYALTPPAPHKPNDGRSGNDVASDDRVPEPSSSSDQDHSSSAGRFELEETGFDSTPFTESEAADRQSASTSWRSDRSDTPAHTVEKRKSFGIAAARNPRVRFDGDPTWDRRDGRGVVVQRFTLPVSGWQRVVARLAVSLSQTGLAREIDPPLGAARPVFIAWESADGALVTEQALETCGGDAREWLVIVRPAPDTITDIDLHVEPAERVMT